MVTVPRTTPVVREKFLNDDQGLRSFHSLNPWLFSSTPSAWQKNKCKVSRCARPLRREASIGDQRAPTPNEMEKEDLCLFYGCWLWDWSSAHSPNCSCRVVIRAEC